MKKLLLAAIASGALSTVSAFAADMPVKAPPAPAAAAYNWSGFYIGVQTGYGWTNVFDTEYAPLFSESASGKPSGWLAGGHAGYNLQLNALVLGIEADIEGANIKTSYDPSLQNLAFVPGDQFQTNIKSQGSIRGRIGYPVDRTLFYVTGGWAYARVQTSYSFIGAPLSNQHTDGRGGGTLGGGVEYAWTPNWTTSVEYRYTDFGTLTRPVPFGSFGPIGTSFSSKLTDNVVRAALTYKFAY
jgi:outer membrane immunogenic protein